VGARLATTVSPFTCSLPGEEAHKRHQRIRRRFGTFQTLWFKLLHPGPNFAGPDCCGQHGQIVLDFSLWVFCSFLALFLDCADPASPGVLGVLDPDWLTRSCQEANEGP
jgi:hypothetical protein